MTATTLFDLIERLTSLMRIWNRQHPLLAELQPIQVSALIYLSRCNRYSDTPLAVTEYLGLTKGTEVYVRKVAPLGDPVELTVRGYELSVRKGDAENIEVR